MKKVEEPKEVFGFGLRELAWLPWLPLLFIGFLFVWRGEGYGGFIVPFFFYSLISFPIGVMVRRHYRNDKIGANIAAAILFGGPVLGVVAHLTEQAYWNYSYERSWNLLQEYCERDAKEVIHRTVTDVEGVLQMEPYTEYSLTEGGQYGVPDPWYQFSWQSMDYFMLGVFDGGYYFYEQKLDEGSVNGTYIRNFIRFREYAPKDMSELRGYEIGELEKRDSVVTSNVLSEYGWRSEDLTTDKMRRHWVGGGRIEIVELATQEVVAQLTNFYIARGARSWKKSWQIGGSGRGECRQVSSFTVFLRKVLNPINRIPSEEQLLRIAG